MAVRASLAHRFGTTVADLIQHGLHVGPALDCDSIVDATPGELGGIDSKDLGARPVCLKNVAVETTLKYATGANW
ncbi:MAG: hypothetical protein U5Q16_13015 [Gammaproteobacteria bacterium]|nr:hypothetical protein [Gammaproteobacteria bacterium]